MQWSIGDLLVREIGPPGNDSANNGSLEQIETLAQELGVALATLLKYRRMAATYAPNTRISGASWTAHEAASAAADPPKVMAQAAIIAKQQGIKVAPPLVREIAAKPEHQKPDARPSVRSEARQAPGGWGLQLISAMDGATTNLRRIVTMLQAVGRDEELSPKTERMLIGAMDRCEGHISWIRASLRGEDITAEVAEFLQEQV